MLGDYMFAHAADQVARTAMATAGLFGLGDIGAPAADVGATFRARPEPVEGSPKGEEAG